jgi:hypothetical protein
MSLKIFQNEMIDYGLGFRWKNLKPKTQSQWWVMSTINYWLVNHSDSFMCSIQMLAMYYVQYLLFINGGGATFSTKFECEN